jgi:O-antigen/teichoic acid export membrane protein
MASGEGRGVPDAAWRRFVVPLTRLFAGVGAAAVATYVYLIVVARTVGPEAYASFSVFWAVVVIAAAGVYLPIEQETGRRGVDVHAAGPSRPLGRSALGAALIITAVLAAVLAATWPLSSSFFGDDAWLAAALALGGLGYAAQYPVRGLLSAGRHYGWYASVLGVEALLRIVLVVGLVLLTDAGVGVLAAVVGLAALGSAAVGAAGARAGRLRIPGGSLPLLRSIGTLATGAVALQTLLYGGVLVARGLAPLGQDAAAGKLLAAITITRIPVFLFQSLQALVVPRIAELAVRGDHAGLRTAVRRLVLVVGSLAVATVVGSALIGPWLVTTMFGDDYAVPTTTMALLGLGTGIFLLAVVASDVTVSLGGHRTMALSWIAGLVAGGVSLLLVSGFLLQVTLPLIVGATVAVVLLTRAARVRVAELSPAEA